MIKTIKKSIALFLYLLIISSCSSNKKEIEHPRSDRYSLQLQSDKCFPLDSETTQETEYIQLFDRNDSLIFSFTNEFDNSIVLYDYATEKCISKIKLNKEGADGIGSLSAYCYHNNDSIFLYNRMSQFLFLANKEGEIKSKKEITNIQNLTGDSIFVSPMPFPRTNSPLQIVENNLLIPGFLPYEFEGENGVNRPTIILYDLNKKSIKYSDSYPEIYHKGNWGAGFTYRYPYYTLSPENKIVMSFSASSYIRVHGVNENQYQEYYAGIKQDQEIKPADKKIDLATFTKEEQRRHFIENLNYGCIHYDKYRNVYYRIAQLPDSSININDILRKPIIVLILDKDFNIVGEVKLQKEKYMLNQCFVGPDGFHIQIESDDDDIMRFKTFQLIKLGS